MTFNSWQFVVFFVVFYAIYLLLRDRRAQNVLLLVGSYYFYSVWDWRFLGLLLASTVLDYSVGRGLGRTEDPRKRKLLLCASIAGNLGMLGFFKYFNFFVDSAEAVLLQLGIPVEHVRLDVVLPVGISFYTFQTLSYAIDVYRRKLTPCRDPLDFAVFVAFFPQLVAGPIERATHLLPQVQRPRTLERSMLRQGMWLIAFGLWKKIVIADNLALFVDPVFATSNTASAFSIYVALVAFAFQIYCDFSAYSDIARGTAALLGFDLMRNFNQPYFAVSPSDFWRRWHISLSTWLRDYLYISLGGNRGGRWREYRNLMTTMLLGGLWHGAAWNYVVWGFYHGALLSLQRLFGVSHPATPTEVAKPTLWKILGMFHLTLLGWLLFRATGRVEAETGRIVGSGTQVLELLRGLFTRWNELGMSLSTALTVAAFAAPIVLLEIWERKESETAPLRLPRPALATVAGCMVAAWIIWGVKAGSAFIYFQF